MAKRKKRGAATRLRVMAEYASSGIWVTGAIGPFRHGMIGHASLGLSRELSEGFERWIESYDANLDDTLDVDAFNAEGRALAVGLKREVGSEVVVVYAPEQPDGSLGIEEEILGPV